MIPREVATYGRWAARRTGLDPDDGESIAGGATGSPLTPRMTHMLQLVAEGNANRQIAATLGLSVNTVNGALVNVLRRLDAADRAHAVAIALRAGLIA